MTEKDVFARFDRMRANSRAHKAKVGPASHPAITIFEDAPCYPIEDLVELYWLYGKFTSCRDYDSEEFNARKEALVAKIGSMKRKPDAPERIYLWPEGKVPTCTDYTDNSDYLYNHDPDFQPYMYELLVPEDVTPKGAIVVCAGGDHGNCLLHEAYQTCLDFNALGYQTFLLCNRPNYNPWCYVECGADTARALRIVRKNAERYRIKPNNVAFAGFSNGGSTGESCIQYYSGEKTVADYFEDYVPDELDGYYGAPDAFLCVYGPRYEGMEFDYTGVVYPPVFYAVGRLDGGWRNLPSLCADLNAHNIPNEVHTFAGVPHGTAGIRLIDGKVRFPNFELWIPLADAFMQDVYRNAEE